MSKKLFADEASELSSAVGTANLIPFLDASEIGDEEVKVLSEATGSTKEFVEEIVELASDAQDDLACCGSDEKKVEEVVEVFSQKLNAAAEKAAKCANFCRSIRNFAEEQKEGEKVIANVAKIASLVSDEVLAKVESDKIVEAISEATHTPVELVSPVVDAVVTTFSRVKKATTPVKAQTKVGQILKTAFADAKEEIVKMDETAPVVPEVKPEAEPKLVKEDPKEEGLVLPVEGQKQDEETNKVMDPKPGEGASDPKVAGAAMVAAQELTTVAAAENVPEPAVFSRKPASSNESLFGPCASILKTIKERH